MIPEACQKFLKLLTEAMREQLMAGEQLPPVVLFAKDDRPALPIPMDFSSNQAKNKSAALVRALAEVLRPDYIVHVSEAWTAHHQSKEEAKDFREKYTSIENYPLREEVVMVSLETENGTWLGMSHIKIVDGKRTFDDFELKLMDGLEGRMTGFMPRPNTPTH